jgi:hypothetical protein|tara:strand:+ start:433 stop:672 length:240 start_codon:yes stop_codon:yes gene_type:complete
MNQKLIQFLSNADNELSSKRLAGISAGLIFCLLSLIGGIAFLFQESNDDFISLLWVVSTYSAALLGVSVFENKSKSKKK